jgi:predicted PurR-regulated permease PerM
MQHDNYLSRALEIFIHIGLLTFLAGTCLLILYPFLPLIFWGIIISIAIYPGYRRVRSAVGGRSTVAAVGCTVFLLALLIIPVVLLAGSLVEGIQSLSARLKEGTAIIPPVPPRIEAWPIVGAPLKEGWEFASKNVSGFQEYFAPQIRASIPKVLSVSAGIGMAILQWIVSILLSGVLLACAATGEKVAHSVSRRFFGDQGPEFVQLTGATIRSVTTGIIGVAFIQSIFAVLGFLMVGLPAVGLWGTVFLIAAVLQLSLVVLIPACIYVLAVASTTKAVLFLVWCLIVGTMDNVLKPLLLGRGVAVPMIVVFLGVVGGFVAMGPMGLFLGAIVLSIGYRLLVAWVEEPLKARVGTSEKSVSAGSGF